MNLHVQDIQDIYHQHKFRHVHNTHMYSLFPVMVAAGVDVVSNPEMEYTKNLCTCTVFPLSIDGLESVARHAA